jgi:hypothetical protein
MEELKAVGSKEKEEQIKEAKRNSLLANQDSETAFLGERYFSSGKRHIILMKSAVF